MNTFYPEQPPPPKGLQSTSNQVGGMIATIVLDQTHNTFTNLDVISGRVVLRLESNTNVSSVVIKLEGESMTRLKPPPVNADDNPKSVREVHKILYKLQTVFPPPNLMTAGKSSFTLPAGHHQYPFTFKIPFNNNCQAFDNILPSFSIGTFGFDRSAISNHHVKKLLPPTLAGFPGEAGIQYYLKATVSRPNILKENARAFLPFNFCPIEPPRPPPSTTGAETFARRKHQFAQPFRERDTLQKPKKSLFSRKSSMNLSTPSTAPLPEAPLISVEARLPEPPILTAGHTIPLRLICAVLNANTSNLALRSLEIAIVMYTHIRAQQVRRTAMSSIVMISRSNIMQYPISFKDGSTETLIDSTLWRDLRIPGNLPPSFETCNLSRNYELIVRVGTGYDSQGRSQDTIMELRLPFQLFSGIRPPAELLEAMATASGMNGPVTSPAAPPLPPRSEKTGLAPPAIPRRPVPAPQTHQQPLPSQTQASGSRMQPPPLPHSQDEPPHYSEAPPSYEDAIADTMPSVQTDDRPQYAPPPPEEADPLLSSDEKRGWH